MPAYLNIPNLNIPKLRTIFIPLKIHSIQNFITSCKHYVVFDRIFKCTVTGKVYYSKGEMNCESTNIIHLITCMECLEQYIGSAIKFRSRFMI